MKNTLGIKVMAYFVILLFTAIFISMPFVQAHPFYDAKGVKYKVVFEKEWKYIVYFVIICYCILIFEKSVMFILNKTPIGDILSSRFRKNGNDVKK